MSERLYHQMIPSSTLKFYMTVYSVPCYKTSLLNFILQYITDEIDLIKLKQLSACFRGILVCQILRWPFSVTQSASYLGPEFCALNEDINTQFYLRTLLPVMFLLLRTSKYAWCECWLILIPSVPAFCVTSKTIFRSLADKRRTPETEIFFACSSLFGSCYFHNCYSQT